MVKLSTWLAMGAAATVTSASVAASAVLYRGTLYTDESFLLSWFIRRQERKNKSKRERESVSTQQEKKMNAKAKPGGAKALRKAAAPHAQTLVKGVQGAAENFDREKIDPVLRRRAVPTAVKALGISTAMALSVGSLCAVFLTYAIEGGGSDAVENDAVEVGEPQAAAQSQSVAFEKQQASTHERLPEEQRESSKPPKDDKEVNAGATPRRTIRQFLTESFKGKS